MTPFPLPGVMIEDAVKRAFEEDLGAAGDITTLACISENAKIEAVIAARKAGAIAGIAPAKAAFELIDPNISIEIINGDGARIAPKDIVMRLSGPARSILTAERVALNFLGHLSGIAAATAALVDAVDGTKASIACTRKTTPGLRAFEKHAVICGGGKNHSFGLNDAVMIKDNHIAAAGGITQALQRVKKAVGHTVKIEIEVDTLDQFKEVLSEGADIVLLDNMSLEDLKNAVAINQGAAVLEASGNITVQTVKAIAQTGVDVISSGWITHSAPTLDLGMDFL